MESISNSLITDRLAFFIVPRKVTGSTLFFGRVLLFVV